jgi:hypothetical protein
MDEKLDIGGVLNRVFDIYREQATLLLPAALILFVPVAIIAGIIQTGGTNLIFAVVVIATGIVATYWYQGMVVEAVRDMEDDKRDFTIGGLFQAVTPVLGPLIGAGLLAGLGIAVGLLLLIIPGLILLSFWAVVAPVIVIERSGIVDAFKRSMGLVRGTAKQVFGVIVLLFILQFLVSTMLQAIGAGIGDNPGTRGIASLIGQVLVAPLSALAAAVMYFELRRLHGEEPIPGGPEGAGGGAAASRGASSGGESWGGGESSRSGESRSSQGSQEGGGGWSRSSEGSGEGGSGGSQAGTTSRSEEQPGSSGTGSSGESSRNS